MTAALLAIAVTVIAPPVAAVAAHHFEQRRARGRQS